MPINYSSLFHLEGSTTLQGPTLVTEPVKGKAPRVDHHNLIPAHLNEELPLACILRCHICHMGSPEMGGVPPIFYGHFGKMTNAHAKVWRLLGCTVLFVFIKKHRGGVSKKNESVAFFLMLHFSHFGSRGLTHQTGMGQMIDRQTWMV